MHPVTLELMRDQVRGIYRALTGSDMPEAEPPASAPEVSVDDVARRFAELETLARAIPAVVERVPPFSFAPPLDALEDDRELLIEVAVPGVDKGDVNVERNGDLLVISGVRLGERVANGRSYLHAEIARGPFHRVVRLPSATAGEPRIEVDRGLIRIRLAKAPPATTPAKA
jgi:HSP20 family molecular chaperone IbpA